MSFGREQSVHDDHHFTSTHSHLSHLSHFSLSLPRSFLLGRVSCAWGSLIACSAQSFFAPVVVHNSRTETVAQSMVAN